MIPFISRRTKPSATFHLGSTSLGREDGDFEASLIVTPGAAPRVRLTQLAWGAGVGWFPQRTLELSVEEAHQIASLLSQAPKGRQSALDRVAESSGAPATEHSPIDLAEARARRATSTTGSAPSPTGATGRVPTPISDCDRAASLSDGSASS
jgi:hypothetical protein